MGVEERGAVKCQSNAFLISQKLRLNQRSLLKLTNCVESYFVHKSKRALQKLEVK